MRCRACDTLLNESDLKRKDTEGKYLDLCGECYRHSFEAWALATEVHDTIQLELKEARKKRLNTINK